MATSLPSYSSGASSVALLGETIGANLSRTVERFADREALVDVPSGRRWTYREFAAEVDTLALGLLDYGVRNGDRIGIWAPNVPEWVLVQYAAAKIGAILVTINPAYRPYELKYVLQHAGIHTLIATPEFRTSDYAAMIASVRPECPDLQQVILLDTPDWEALIDAGRNSEHSALSEVEDLLSYDDPIAIQYTSGTTGAPKGATLSHHNILNNAFISGERLGYTENDRICVPVPFYHCFGMVTGNLASTSRGATVVIPAAAFDPKATLEAVESERCTSLYGVPTMYIAELSELGEPGKERYDVSSLRTGVLAGASSAPALMREIIQRLGMTEVISSYGMTETSPVSTQSRGGDSIERRATTVGAALSHVEMKVADPVTGKTVPRGEAGEVCVRGYSVMLGYWNDPEKTAETIDDTRWLHTGDLGVMDEDGYLAITGRSKDIIIRGGENIYPREIEDFLYTHPDIDDVQVVGVPDDHYGEELVAWIRMRKGAAPLDAARVKEFCSGQIAHFKIPRYVRLIEEFPMTVTGKIRKVELREASAALLADDSLSSS